MRVSRAVPPPPAPVGERFVFKPDFGRVPAYLAATKVHIRREREKLDALLAAREVCIVYLRCIFSSCMGAMECTRHAFACCLRMSCVGHVATGREGYIAAWPTAASEDGTQASCRLMQRCDVVSSAIRSAGEAWSYRRRSARSCWRC
jgi:hypothetical protein